MGRLIDTATWWTLIDERQAVAKENLVVSGHEGNQHIGGAIAGGVDRDGEPEFVLVGGQDACAVGTPGDLFAGVLRKLLWWDLLAVLVKQLHVRGWPPCRQGTQKQDTIHRNAANG